MKKILLLMLTACIPIAAVAGETVPPPELTMAQIIEKNIAARGGLEDWRKIQTMAWLGHIESTHGPAKNLPFILEMKRPNKTRFEIKAQNQTDARIFDGTHGWKIRPGKNGMPELQPYTTAELKFAQDWPGIDGPLIDYKAKGITVSLDGIDQVEGNKAYRLNIKMSSGTQHHLWIDAKTFLDIKYDRESKNAFGQTGIVSVFFRNYHKVEGLQIPLTLESGSAISKTTDKMIIDRIALNPTLKDSVFAKPNVPWQRREALVRAGSPQMSRQVTGVAPTISSQTSREGQQTASGNGSVQ